MSARVFPLRSSCKVIFTSGPPKVSVRPRVSALWAEGWRVSTIGTASAAGHNPRMTRPRMSRARLLDVYERLVRHRGPAGWWPGDSAFEVCVGAILVQNTAWPNVEKAL